MGQIKNIKLHIVTDIKGLFRSNSSSPRTHIGNMVAYLDTKADYDEALKNPKVVIDFTATWCGPCKRIGPVFESLVEQYPDIKFFKVDVDKNGEVSELEGISAMPTFKFYLNGKAQEFVLQGASDQKLKENLQKLNDM